VGITVLAHSYFRNPSTHWCFVNHVFIVLHVDRNQYFSIPAHTLQPLLPYIDIQSHERRATGLLEVPQELTPLISDLVSSDLLTASRTQPGARSVPPTAKPDRLLPQFPANLSARELRSHAFPFLKACATADWQLRHHSLTRIVSRILARRLGSANPATRLAAESTYQLASIFVALRPFYPRRYRCMFDCLALLEFLALWNRFPNWIFGVLADPFRAHCWVQDQGLVLCDTRDFSAARFVPIMTV
jgi:hypothetical protein